MRRKDYRGYLAIVGEGLKQMALQYKAEAIKNDPWSDGVVFGWYGALDLMWDHLEMHNLVPGDLCWEGFVPDRDLMGAPSSRRKPSREAKPGLR